VENVGLMIFERVGKGEMKTYICLICGYIHIGENPPEKCPVCDASSEEFELHEETKEIEQSANSWNVWFVDMFMMGIIHQMLVRYAV